MLSASTPDRQFQQGERLCRVRAIFGCHCAVPLRPWIAAPGHCLAIRSGGRIPSALQFLDQGRWLELASRAECCANAGLAQGNKILANSRLPANLGDKFQKHRPPTDGRDCLCRDLIDWTVERNGEGVAQHGEAGRSAFGGKADMPFCTAHVRV